MNDGTVRKLGEGAGRGKGDKGADRLRVGSCYIENLIGEVYKISEDSKK